MQKRKTHLCQRGWEVDAFLHFPNFLQNAVLALRYILKEFDSFFLVPGDRDAKALG